MKCELELRMNGWSDEEKQVVYDKADELERKAGELKNLEVIKDDDLSEDFSVTQDKKLLGVDSEVK